MFNVSITNHPQRHQNIKKSTTVSNHVNSLMHTCVQSCFSLFATPWTAAHQAPLSMVFLRQEYWSGLPHPPPGDLSYPGIEAMSPALTDSLPLSHLGGTASKMKELKFPSGGCCPWVGGRLYKLRSSGSHFGSTCLFPHALWEAEIWDGSWNSWPPVYIHLLPLIQSDTNQGVAVKGVCRSN